MSDIDCIRLHLEIAEVAKRTRSDMPSIVNFKDALSRLETIRAELAAAKGLAQTRLKYLDVAMEACDRANARVAGLEAALRTWNKAFSQIPCWARKWDAFRKARSAAKDALDE